MKFRTLSSTLYIAATALMVTFIGCSKSSTVDNMDKEEGLSLKAIEPSYDNSRHIRVLEQLIEAESENVSILYSPYSADAALSMAMAASQGETLEAFMDYFGLTSDNQINSFYQGRLNEKTTLETESETVKITINNLCAHDANRLELDQDFAQSLEKWWEGELKIEDFSQSESAKQNINDWVKETTEGKIDKIIDKIKDEDVLFLINTVYFKGDWAHPFATEATSERSFYTDEGEVMAEMMYQRRNVPFYQSDAIQAIGLDYADEKHALIMVRASNDQAVNLNEIDIDSIVSNLVETDLMINIPKFKLAYSSKLNEPLSAVGLGPIFQNADFTKMGTPLIGPRIKLSEVQQRVVFEIDETGSEGAAATSIGFGVTSLPPIITFDHPYFFALYNKETNTILFAGYVRNPLAE